MNRTEFIESEINRLTLESKNKKVSSLEREVFEIIANKLKDILKYPESNTDICIKAQIDLLKEIWFPIRHEYNSGRIRKKISELESLLTD